MAIPKAPFVPPSDEGDVARIGAVQIPQAVDAAEFIAEVDGQPLVGPYPRAGCLVLAAGFFLLRDPENFKSLPCMELGLDFETGGIFPGQGLKWAEFSGAQKNRPMPD